MQEPIVSPAVPESERIDKIGQVGPGMDVYDHLGIKVGKVDGLHGGASDEQPRAATVLPVAVSVSGQQPVPLVATVVQPGSKVPEFDEAHDRDDDIPHELRQRLEHDGFIRIDAGFLKHHRYALREQIDRVQGDRVILNVAAGDLFKH